MRAWFAGRLLAMVFCCTLVWPATMKVDVPEWVGAAGEVRNLFLRIDDVRLPPHAGGVVRIYANLPDATWETGAENEHYLGYFSIVPRGSKEAAEGVYRKSVVVDISSKLNQIAGRGVVEITLIPSPGSGPESKTELHMGRVSFSAR